MAVFELELLYEEIGKMNKAAACADGCLSNNMSLVDEELERIRRLPKSSKAE